MPDINIKDPSNTPPDESLHFKIGYLRATLGKRNGRRMTASDVVRELITDAYKRELRREALKVAK